MTHHSEAIIQWLFLFILLLSGLIIARSLFAKKQASTPGADASSGDATEIQAFLQKITEQMTKLEAIPASQMVGQVGASVDAQVQELKAELDSRTAEISILKAAGSAQPSVDADGLNSRIKELEAKLSEYEILEDDIADLSLYKEENARLKEEIDKFKSGDPLVRAAAAPAPVADEVSVLVDVPVVQQADDIVAEFAQVVESKDSVPSLSDELKKVETGNPMDDFESAVKLEKKLTGGESADVASLMPGPDASTTADEISPTGDGDDLFGEFADSIKTSADSEVPEAVEPPAPAQEIKLTTSEPDAELSAALDTEKMMAEMAALVIVEAPADATGIETDGIDTDKMAAEALSLTKD